MKRDVTHKNAILIVLAGIILGLFLVNFVAAQGAFDPVRDLFTASGWEEGNLSPTLAKYLFFVLMTLFVYSIIDTTGIFGKGYIIVWPVSIIVSFLSTAFLAPNDVWLLITSYDALGMTILATIPFAILMMYTYRVAKNSDKGAIIFQRAVWAIYFVFMIGFIFAGLFVTKQIELTDPMTYIFLVSMLIVGGCVFWNNALLNFFETAVDNAAIAAHARRRRVSENVDKDTADSVKDV